MKHFFLICFFFFLYVNSHTHFLSYMHSFFHSFSLSFLFSVWLFRAAALGKFEVIQTLSAFGANFSTLNKVKENALHFCTGSHELLCTRFLGQRGTCMSLCVCVYMCMCVCLSLEEWETIL